MCLATTRLIKRVFLWVCGWCGIFWNHIKCPLVSSADTFIDTRVRKTLAYYICWKPLKPAMLPCQQFTFWQNVWEPDSSDRGVMWNTLGSQVTSSISYIELILFKLLSSHQGRMWLYASLITKTHLTFLPTCFFFPHSLFSSGINSSSLIQANSLALEAANVFVLIVQCLSVLTDRIHCTVH